MAKLINIVSFSGTNPYLVQVDDSSGVLLSDHLSDNSGKLYRVSIINDATHLTVVDDISPDAPHGSPMTGTGSVFTPTTLLKLSQAPFQAPSWDEIVRHDARVVDDYESSFQPLTRRLWVDANTTLVTADQNGAINKPFKTVQQAIDVVNAAASGSIYHISVGFGNYGAETLTFQPNRRLLIEGPIQGATILGSVTYNCTGASTTTLAFRNVHTNITTVVDSGTPATAANLIFENCRTNGVVTSGTSVITLNISGTTLASFDFPTLVVASTVGGSLSVVGPVFINNTLFLPACTTISGSVFFCAGSSFEGTDFNVSSTVSSFRDTLFKVSSTFTFTGSYGDLTFDTVSIATFIDSGSLSVNGTSIISTQRSTGWLSGGVITRGGGLDIDVTAGTGYIFQDDDITYYITWATGSVTLPPNTLSSVYVNQDGDIVSGVFPIDVRNGIVLAIVQTNNTMVVALTTSYLEATQIVPQFAGYVKDVIGPIHVDGLAVTVNGGNPLRLDVDSGTFYVNVLPLEATATAPILFTYWYRDGSGGFTHVDTVTEIDPDFYDDGSGTLAALPVGKFKKDLLFTTVHNGGITEYHVVYAQEFYDSQAEAEAGDLPEPPEALTRVGIRCGGIVIESAAAAIDSITDERPRLGQLASGTTATNDHGLLSGLSDDDHPQYQLVTGKNMANGYAGLDGSSKLTGSQQVYGTLVNTATEGNDARVPTQAENGALQGTSGTPSNINRYVTDADPRNTNTRTPVAHSASHSPGSADALVTAVANTILPDAAPAEGVALSFSRSDHTHGIAAAVAGAIQIGDAASEGVSSSFSRADHVHSLAAPAAPADVTKDAASAGAATAPARADHKHDVSTAAPVALGSANAEGSASSLARSDHVHIAPTIQTTFDEISVNTTTTSTTFVDLLTRVISTGANNVLIHFSAGFSAADQETVFFRVTIDGVAQRGAAQTVRNGLRQGSVAIVLKRAVTAASHTIKIQWRVTAGTGSVQPVLSPDAEHASLLISEVTV